LEYVRRLVDSIVVSNEIDQRDRAMISFTLLSGMRNHAIASLPLGCIDDAKRLIVQNPRQGVRTKCAKLMPVASACEKSSAKIKGDWRAASSQGIYGAAHGLCR